MTSILIVLPYFGRFPNYFNLFLKSCAVNSTINWLLVTDQKLDNINIPDNFLVKQMEFPDIQKQAELMYGKAPATPYSLCKYRVVYHELFGDNVKDFDFWGFCDCDLIFGNLREFITENILLSYDKISWRGHLTLFKNNYKVNNAYKKEFPGFKTFQGCINDSDGINLFDEVGINKIFNRLGLKIYEDLLFADLLIRSNNFVCQHNIFDPKTNVNQLFRWTEKGLYRIYAFDKNIVTQPIAYVHFLKRPMEWGDCSIEKDHAFLIVTNKFVKDEKLTIEKLLQYSRKAIYWNYIFPRLKPKFIYHKILEKFRSKNIEPDVYERNK